jgi:hypothetical protein
MRQAAEAGRRVLADGGSAVDAVECATKVLKALPVFNAGVGSALNASGGIGLLTVLGSGAVYIVDGSRVSYTNLAEARSDVTLSLHNMTVPVLAEGDGFDLAKRDPRPPQS